MLGTARSLRLRRRERCQRRVGGVGGAHRAVRLVPRTASVPGRRRRLRAPRKGGSCLNTHRVDMQLKYGLCDLGARGLA